MVRFKGCAVLADMKEIVQPAVAGGAGMRWMRGWIRWRGWGEVGGAGVKWEGLG